jgi:hypothetical protein
MALSAHQELADVLRGIIAAWGSLPSGFSVERVYSVDKYVGGWTDAAPGRICVLVSSITPERTGRNTDQDDVTISVVWLQKLTDFTTITQTDLADTNADALRKFLRSKQKATLPVFGRAASRLATGLPTPYAADMIRNNEIFCSVIQTTYRLFAEVA